MSDPIFDQLLDEQRQRKSALAGSLTTSVSTNPDAFATQKRVAGFLGYPVAAVEAMPDLAEQAKVLRVQNDIANAPALKQRYTDADFAKLAHDDSGVLATLETSIAQGVRYMMGATPTGGVIGTIKAMPDRATQGIAGVKAMGADIVEPWARLISGKDNQAAQMSAYYKTLARQAEARGDALDPPDDSVVGGGLQSGVRSLLQSSKYLPIALAGGPVGAAVALGGMVAETIGQSYLKADEKGLPLLSRLIYGISDGVVEYATEKGPLGALVHSIKAGTPLGKAILQNAGKEMKGEQIATALQDLNAWAALNPDKPFADYLAERPEAAAKTAIGVLVGAAGNTALTHSMQRSADLLAGRDRQAEYNVAQATALQEQLQMALNSKLRERSPDEFRAAVQSMADSAADTNPEIARAVFVDAEVLNQLPPEVQQLLPPAVLDQMAQALATGDAVEIPIGDALAIAPGTPLEQTLVEHGRIGDPSMPSQFETKQAGALAQQMLATEAQGVIQQAADAQAMQDSSDRVAQTILTQLQATGRFRQAVNEGYATWAAAFYTTMAGRTGMTPEEMQAKYPLRIVDQTGAGEVMDQPGSANFDKWFGDSKVVDAAGKPLVVYHGSAADFDTFKLQEGQYGKGVYFWESAERASQYASLAATEGPRGNRRKAGGSPVVYPVYVRNATRLPNGAWMVQNPADIKSATGNNGDYDPQNPSILKQSVSSRVPWAKPSAKNEATLENPLTARLQVGLDAFKDVPDALDNAVALLTTYPNWKPSWRLRTTESKVERFIGEVVGNLLWLHDLVPAEIRQRSKLWYDGANVIANEFATRYGVTLAQASAVLAVNSPQTEWFTNVSRAERILDIWFNQQDFGWSPEMEKTASKILGKDQYSDDLSEIRGKSLRELSGGSTQQAMWLRVFDEAHNDRSHRIVTPEGTFGDWVVNADGVTQSKTAWAGFGHISKSLEVIQNGAIDNISLRLGNEHKVRSFYNNIFSPTDPVGDVTIDTHAVAAGLLRPLSGTAKEVEHNLGGGVSNALKGLSGTYGIYAEAYRRAAEARGILPREMQSITWEGVRGLYTDTFKSSKGAKEIEQIWKDFRANKLTEEEVRSKIIEISGGINEPNWWQSDRRPPTETWSSSYGGELSPVRVPGPAASPAAGGDPAGGGERGGAGEGAAGQDSGVLEQAARDQTRDLLVQHNLSAENLLHAQRMGGIPVPSLAVTKKQAPMESFGEITLLGGQQMADPKGYAGTKVFGADIYSPRYPSVEFKLDNKAQRALNEALAAFRKDGDRQLYGDDVRRPEDVTSNKPFKRWAADRLGKDEASLSWTDLNTSAAALMRQIGASEQIFQGFTNSGNRKYTPHTLDNVIKILKKELRGGERFNYGVGSLRAKFTPQFHSVAQIQKAKDRLLGKAEFEAVKKEIDAEFIALSDSLDLSLEQTTEVIEDAAKMGAKRAIDRAFKDYKRDDSTATDEQAIAVGDFARKLVNLPTEYFEAKILRAVDVAEFSAAVVPANSSQDVLDALAERGVKRIAMYDPAVQGDRAAKIAEFDDLFFQASQDTPRGTFNPKSLELALNANANLSTFIHETGHFFLEVMADIASQPNAPAEITQDMRTLLAWFGVQPDAWAGMTLDQKRPYHERFAESIEQYVMEGKAPSAELQPLFRKFRAWVLNVYRSAKAFIDSRTGATEIQLSDEVRKVFDRMLASQEEIRQAEETAGMMPNQDATADAVEKLTARSMRDLAWTVRAVAKAVKALQRDAVEARKEVEAEVTLEVDAMPEMRAKAALDALQISPDFTAAAGMWREARAAALAETQAKLKADLYAANPGETGLKKGQLLAKNKRTLANMAEAAMIAWEQANPKPTKPENVTDADLAVIADSFGFADVDTMLTAIDAVGKRADLIEGLTDQRMLEQHGELVDEASIQAAANQAVHNEARARSLATELKAQAEMANPRADTGQTNAAGSKITVNAIVEAAKQFAANVVAGTPLKDMKALAWKHTAAERRANTRWQKATMAGDTAAAVKAKQDQVLHNAAAKAAMDAMGEAKDILEFFRRVVKDGNEKTVEKGRDPDVVNAARAILAAYGVGVKGAKSALDYLGLVEKNDPAMFAALQPSLQGALNMAQPLNALTMEQLQGLHEEIQSMWHLAKRSRQMEVQGDLIDIDDAADELSTRMAAIGVPLEAAGTNSAMTPAETRWRWLQFAGSLLRRVEQWSEGMDGKYGGPFLRLVFGPVKAAADAYRADRVIYRKAYQALVDSVAPALRKGLIQAPELGYTFGKGHNGIGHAELLHAILHTGNASNKRKLLLGRNWATENADGTMDTQKWDAFIQRMHDTGVLAKAHYDFAQGVWDLLEKTKPLAQKAHRDVFGRYFAEVTADAFDTPFGNYRGGYVPAQADPRIVQEADMRNLASLENESMSFSFPATNKGFTKGRVEYNRPLMLDLRTIGQHIDKVLLFAHMEPAVRDVNKLLSRKPVSQPLGKIDPTIYAGMLTPWLNRSARQVVETPIVGDGGISRVLSAARGRAGMALMFANISNTLQQVTGFAGAMAKLKADGMKSTLLQSTALYIRGPKKMATAVAAASPFMANRMANEIAAINDAMNEILLDPGLYERAQAWTAKHAYFLQSAMDNTMGPIIWTSAYNAALGKSMSQDDAVRYADGVIRQTQGSTLPEDISRIETGPAYARVFTQFIGYFNMMANTNATAVKQIAMDVGLKRGAGKALGLVMLGTMVPIWMAEAIAQAMRGGPDDPDEDGWLDDWLMAVFGFGTIKGAFAMVPFVGQLANAGMNRFNGNPADDKMSLSPAVSLLEAAVGVPVDIYKAITDEVKLRTLVRDVASAVSIATGLPAMAIARPLGYLAGVEQGQIEPTSAADAVRGAITGSASPDSKQ